jgi:hypothetical protein
LHPARHVADDPNTGAATIGRSARGVVDDGLRASDAFRILQWGQIKLGFVVLALGCLLQCAGTFQAALPLFAN